MVHRDELQAALARMAALEAHIKDLERALAERGAADTQLLDQKRVIEALRRELAETQHALAVMTPQRYSGELPTAHQHNLGFPPMIDERTEQLPVACPRCAGEQRLQHMVCGVMRNRYGDSAVCPACGYQCFVRSA